MKFVDLLRAFAPAVVLAAALALVLPSLASAADAPASAPAPVILIGAPDAGAPAPGIRLLVGGGAPKTLPAASVIRLGRLDGPLLGGADIDLYPSDRDASDPVTCLTEAVYYEARSESRIGQEAVAQVVINRTHQAIYPTTVCGVVFQRSHATSGCQFTFVCDGSMARPTDWNAWGQARAVAQQAMAGFVLRPMRNATHYHAAWMTPYWSSSLVKIGQIGGHIFYR